MLFSIYFFILKLELEIIMILHETIKNCHIHQSHMLWSWSHNYIAYEKT